MRAALVVVALATLAGCWNDQTFACQAGISCGTTQVATCCTTGHCEYRVDGHTFPCTGTDCTAAATDVRTYCSAPGCPDASAQDAGTLDASGCVR